MVMKIEFTEQQYQLDAVKAITDIFDGQTMKIANFTVSTGRIIGQETSAIGIGNKLELAESELLENVQKIQMRNRLPKSLDIKERNFTIEMETGTGKTYVYTRTVFELNKLYGFSKFIIVVPSVAIREGVYKSLQMTLEHFKEHYPEQQCHFFKYDSSKLEQVRDFALSANIEIMIINIDAFKKSFEEPEKENKANLIHRERDTMNGMKPIQFIQQTNPIVIIDEPQSVDNTDKAKEAIAFLNPLCKLRYSATHRDTYNLLYRLNPVDAYNQRLVKKIEVLSVQSADDFNKPYIRLVSTSNEKGYTAKIEIDVKQKNGTVKRTIKEVNSASKNDLYILSGERDLYQGYLIESIDCMEGNESIEFTNGLFLYKGEVFGDIDDDLMKRYQIRETIRTHLDKELYLVPQGIKVLTLFFIDKVENYRLYPEGQPPQKGKYALMFEEEYLNFVNRPKYRTLFEEDKYIANQAVETVHDGYFAQDRKGNFKNSSVTKDGSLRSNKDDESAFELIMKKKEELLSFETPLRFIFSHSALKEGWDNPNVFQICTLVETKDTFTKRQKIGRGLRLAVNQKGIRPKDPYENINILTVIANESYEEFAASLQNEMEQETGVKFGYLESHAFATIIVQENGLDDVELLGYEHSEQLFNYLVQQKYISTKGKVESKLKRAIIERSFEVPEKYELIKPQIETVITNAIKLLPIVNQTDKVKPKLNKEVLVSNEFKELWDRIKYKTTFSVQFDCDTLINNCITSIQTLPIIKPRQIARELASVDIVEKGVSATSKKLSYSNAAEEVHQLPDILRYLQDHTQLKRNSIIKMLLGSGRLEDFKVNPQKFMELVSKIINKEKRKMILDGVKYKKVGNHDYYEQSLFLQEELIGYMRSNVIEVKSEKSVYSYVKYDSEIERCFAERLNLDSDVRLFLKIPRSFVIDTPLGTYNPDWAILYDKDGEETLYFVVETKGSTEQEDLRFKEDAKIQCGIKHFEALNSEVKYDVVNSYEQFKEKV